MSESDDENPDLVLKKEELRRLLLDANRIISYSIRNALPVNPEFIRIVSRLEDLVAAQRDVDTEDFVSFTILFDTALRNIRPINLMNLGSPWKPFREGVWSIRENRLIQTACALVCVSFFVLTGYYTDLYVKMTNYIAQVTFIDQQNVYEKADNLYIMYLNDPVSFSEFVNGQGITNEPQDNKPVDAVKIGNIIRDSSEVRKWDSKLQNIKALMLYADSNFYLRNDLVTGQRDSSAAGVDNKSTLTFTAPEATDKAMEDTAKPPLWGKTEFFYNIGDGYIAQSQDTGANRDPRPTIVDRIGDHVHFLGTFLLPVFYGTIGALVYAMRRLMDPMVPDDALPKTLVRTFLGGLAGFSVTVVFNPMDLAHGGTTASGMAVFSVAFLLGFSIEVFFSLLDRMVHTLSQSILGAGRGRTADHSTYSVPTRRSAPSSESAPKTAIN